MFKLSVNHTTKGKDPAIWIKEVQDSIYPEVQNEIKLSADAAAEIMRRILLNSGYKLDKLANAIQSEVIIDTAAHLEIGIGRISDLPVGQTSGASYWEAFNAGFKVTQANIGYFTSGSGLSADKTFPEAGISGQEWVHTGKERGSFYMKPNKIIQPLKYIEIGNEELIKHIKKEITKFTKNLEQSSK